MGHSPDEVPGSGPDRGSAGRMEGEEGEKGFAERLLQPPRANRLQWQGLPVGLFQKARRQEEVIIRPEKIQMN